MTETSEAAAVAEAALDELIRAMRVGQDRAFNARCILAAIQKGEIPGVTFSESDCDGLYPPTPEDEPRPADPLPGVAAQRAGTLPTLPRVSKVSR